MHAEHEQLRRYVEALLAHAETLPPKLDHLPEPEQPSVKPTLTIDRRR